MKIRDDLKLRRRTMADHKLSREEELVAFFVNRCPGNLGRTRLMKLLYLADYESRRYLGRPITGIKYVWHFYGPYEPKLPEWIESLKGGGIIVEEPMTYPSGVTGYLYTPGPKSPSVSFAPAEMEILSYVCRQYSQVPLRDLLDDVVYQTEPMLKAQEKGAKNQLLEMNIVDNSKRNELSVSFEELLERRRELYAGECVPHAEAMAAVEQQLAHAPA